MIIYILLYFYNKKLSNFLIYFKFQPRQRGLNSLGQFISLTLSRILAQVEVEFILGQKLEIFLQKISD